MKWPESSIAYHRYINNNNKSATTNITSPPSCYPFTKAGNKEYKVEIVAPSIEIIRNIPLKPHKRLTLKQIEDDETIYKIGDNYIKRIIRRDTYEYIMNNRYRLKTTDNMFGDELISLLYIY